MVRNDQKLHHQADTAGLGCQSAEKQSNPVKCVGYPQMSEVVDTIDAKAFRPPSAVEIGLSDAKLQPEKRPGTDRTDDISVVRPPRQSVTEDDRRLPPLRTRPTTICLEFASSGWNTLSILDNCSSMSLVSKSTLTTALPDVQVDRSITLDIHGVGRQSSVGFVITEVHVKTRSGRKLEFRVQFHVLEEFLPGVCLGMDIISDYAIDIITSRKVARIQSVNEEFDISFEILRSRKGFAICCDQTIWVKGHTHQIVGFDKSQLSPGMDYVFEPSLMSIPLVGFLSCPSAIICANTAGIPLSNFTDRKMKVSKGQIIGWASQTTHPEFSVLCASSHVGEEETAAQVDLARTSSWPVHVTEMEFLEGSSILSERCVADCYTANPADLIDSSDREPEPHQVEASYHGFDVARNAANIPHPELISVLDNHRKAFCKEGKPGLISDGTVIEINTGTSHIPAEPLRPVGQQKAEIIRDTINQLLTWDVIEPSNSPASSAVVLVRQNEKWRFCVDYRKLNEVTTNDAYPMQRIDSIFAALGGKKYFSSLDAVKGYHQVPVKESDRWKTAFITQEGLYQYKRMPFGLKCAPAVFQRFMDRLLGSMRWQCALVYIDDLVIFSDTISDHAKHLDAILTAAEKVGLTFSPSKCHFGYDRLDMLGRVISREGLSINRHRAQAIQDIGPPKSLEQLYHIVGLFGFYRIFVFGFATIMAPLTDLTKGVNPKRNDLSWKKQPVAWGEEQQRALDHMKKILSNPPVLAYPDWKRPFILYCDASKEAFAFAIHQTVEPPDHETTHLSNVSEDVTREWVEATKEDPLWADKLKDTASLPDYELDDQGRLLYRSELGLRLCVPEKFIRACLHDCHDSVGHPGIKRSLVVLQQQFFRPRIQDFLRRYIQSCTLCQRTKVPRTKPEGEMGTRTIVPMAFHTIAIDFITGLPLGDNTFDCIMTVVDVFTKTVILVPMRTTYTAESVAGDFVEHVVRRGFLPKAIISDNDKVFVSKFWNSVTRQLGIELSFTSPYHPQSDPAERYNQTLEGILRAYCCDNEKEWSKNLCLVELAMNSLRSRATGYSPHELLYVNAAGPWNAVSELLEQQGRSVESADDFVAVAKARLDDAKFYIERGLQSAKRWYDEQHRQPTTWSVGDKAWIRLDRRPIRSLDRSKISAKNLGPFEVLEVHKHWLKLHLPKNIAINPRISIQHVSKFTPDTDWNRDAAPEPVQVDGENQWEIERIVGKRLFGRHRFKQYKIRWAGFDSSEDTWLFEDDLREDGCGALIDEFEGNQSVAATTEIAERPVCFESRVTRTYEKNYEALELELACLTWAVLKSDKYFDGNRFMVVNDHINFRSVLDTSTPTLYSRQVNKFRMLLQPYRCNMDIRYKPGKQHVNVDSLSRIITINNSYATPDVLTEDHRVRDDSKEERDHVEPDK